MSVMKLKLPLQFRTAILPPNLLKLFKAESEESEFSSNQPKASTTTTNNEETLKAMASAVTLALKPVVNQTENQENGPKKEEK